MVEVSDDTTGVCLVCPLALPFRLQQMHMNTTPGAGRGVGDHRQCLVVTPLRADRAILDVKAVSLMRRRDRVDPGQLLGGRGVFGLPVLHDIPFGSGVAVADGVNTAIDPRVPVGDGARKGDANAHILGGPRDVGSLFNKSVRVVGIVAMHGRPDSGTGHASEGNRCLQVRVNPRAGAQAGDPWLQ